jgi:predicted ArsR family transcriptional regulator
MPRRRSTRDRLRDLLARHPGALDSTQLATLLGVTPQRVRQLLVALGAVRGWRLPEETPKGG